MIHWRNYQSEGKIDNWPIIAHFQCLTSCMFCCFSYEKRHCNLSRQIQSVSHTQRHCRYSLFQ